MESVEIGTVEEIQTNPLTVTLELQPAFVSIDFLRKHEN